MPHGAVLAPIGGFATGIIPPTGVVNGSDANHLKLFGDINGDGKMVYVEYYCDNGDTGTVGSHNLYRNVMEFDIAPAAKPALYGFDDSAEQRPLQSRRMRAAWRGPASSIRRSR